MTTESTHRDHEFPAGNDYYTGHGCWCGVVHAKTVPMLIYCPECSERHIDEGDFATKAHHTHACQSCGAVFRPAVVETHGVRFLPGFKNGTP